MERQFAPVDPTEDFSLGVLGTYPPRKCGIATFTRDLSQAICGAAPHVRTPILAISNRSGGDKYTEPVSFELRQAVKADYIRAAELVNYSDIHAVLVQHEYGIFGGDDGRHVLTFLSTLEKPAIITLHTVFEKPTESQRAIVDQMAQYCEAFVVMSDLARTLLQRSYTVAPECIVRIPHGIPDLPVGEQARHKERFGVGERRMLLTVGLLSPNKGIETVIRALPKIIESCPDVLYFVVGQTHPEVKKHHGESYRINLEREAEKLNVREHLVFRNQFVGFEELCAYLLATDVYLTPYSNKTQITSGTLAYAMGAGTAVVSTPYWDAEQHLALGRGRLVDFGDSAGFAHEVVTLLDDPKLLQSVRTAAYEYSRGAVWPQVGHAYLEVAQKAVQTAQAKVDSPRVHRGSRLPELRLEHLARLSDDTGLIQHATYCIPRRDSGYCVDDNARALRVVLLARRQSGSPQAEALTMKYLSFLQYAQTDDGRFRNFMTYDRVLDAEPGSEDCFGRAIWALGSAITLAPDQGTRRLAEQMLARSIEAHPDIGLRGAANAILGLTSYLRSEPDGAIAQPVRVRLERLVGSLLAAYRENASDDWPWFEPILTYDNAILPCALFDVQRVLPSPDSLEIAIAALGFLKDVCFQEGVLHLVGNRGWYPRGSQMATADEQPTDAAAFVIAFRAAYFVTGEKHYLDSMRDAFDWFLGANRVGVPLYDFSTAGCRDGLEDSGVNENEGAESTVAFLLALLAMWDLVGRPLHTKPIVA